MRTLLVCLIASGLGLAQVPRVGLVELYGARKVPEERLRNAIGVRAGDPLPGSKIEIEERVRNVPGVLLAHVEAECCSGTAAVLYVGIEERDAPHVEFHSPPAGSASLPEVLTDVYNDFVGYFGGAARSGIPTGPSAEAYGVTLSRLATANLDSLRKVLRESEDAEQRAMAASILRFAPLKQAVVDDLQYAMLDDDATVRSSAMRTLQVMAAAAARDPDLGIRVELTWYVELLNSLIWEDRTGAATALVGLTESRDPGTLDYLRDRTLGALIEMARWKTPAHAHAAFVLVGRIAGLPEKEIEESWKRGDREAVISRLPKSKPFR